MTSKLDGDSAGNSEEARNHPIDPMFNRIVVGSTALGFAAMLGTAACLERGPNHGFDFHWHWRALIWMALGVAAAIQLWRLLWRAYADETGKAGKSLMKFCVVLSVVGLGVFLYPVLFVSGDRFNDVLTGLSLATAVLTFVGWMIHYVVKSLIASDESEMTKK